MGLDSRSKIALVCRGGPENGPFSAMAGRVISERLASAGLKISGIYTCSGSTPTALLGCIGEYAKLCHVWANLTPEDVVGKVTKLGTIYRVLRTSSILENWALGRLIEKNWDLERIFSSKAIPIKFPAVDVYSSEYVIFSNRNPKHRPWFLKGVLGAMGLVPFLPPQKVFNPVEAELISPDKIVGNSMLLIDGGYKGNMLLEEAQRDGFDVVFLIDIHGLQPTASQIEKISWAHLTRRGFHILSNTNDLRQFQLSERINEEIEIRNQLEQLADQIAGHRAEKNLRDIIIQMDKGRLRLGDKTKTTVIMVSNKEQSTLFNFANFKHREVLELLYAGQEAGEKVMDELGY